MKNLIMSDIAESHLEPRVARLETGLETLTKNVSEMAISMRENALSTNQKIDSLIVSVTQAQAPKKTDWSVFISLGFLILAIGSAVFWPLNQTAQNNKVDLERQLSKFENHQQLELHPVGAALVKRLEEQIKTHIDNNNRELTEHKAYDVMAHSDLDKKLQLEYNLINSKLETQITALDIKLQLEIKLQSEILKGLEFAHNDKQNLFNDKIYNRVIELEKQRDNSITKELDELRLWRNKANGLITPYHAIPLINTDITTNSSK